jgi:hypothetical protein
MRRVSLLYLPLAVLMVWGSAGAQTSSGGESDPGWKLYGFIKMEAFRDNTEVVKGDWLLFANPGSSPQSEQSVFSMNARHTRLGVDFTVPETGRGTIRAKIETDFAGGFPNSSTPARQPLFRLRHAWVEVVETSWEARFGQDWALIAGPFPNTTNFVVGAAAGNLWMRFPQIRYTLKGDPVRVAFSINRPMAGNLKYDSYAAADLDDVGEGERNGLPWLMSRVWYTHGRATLSASGHYGKELVRDLSQGEHTVSTYSANADAQFSMGPAEFVLRGFYGRNLNSFFGGVLQGINREATSVSTIRSRGGWGQLLYRFDQHWCGTVGAGIDDPMDRDLRPGMRSRNQSFWGNVSYSMADPLTFMLEAQHLRTGYVEGDTGKNLRIQFVTYFKF